MPPERARVVAPETQGSDESHFREGIRDALTLSYALADYAVSLEEVVGVMELADKNDAQLRILMDLVKRIR